MKASILTTSELEWLICKKQVSKVYEYRIISDIKKKLTIFQQLELPLLAHNGFLNELSVFTQKLSAITQIPNSMIYCHSTETDNCTNITSEFSEKITYIRNNTYKNNNTDKDGRAGGLAWLGYRLDMAGITCSNHVRPTINLIIMICILQIFSTICLKINNHIKLI